MERRGFINTLACAGALSFGACTSRPLRASVNKKPLSEGNDGFFAMEEDIKPDLATLVYSHTGPILLVRQGSEIKAYESICPHTMCELNDGEREQPMKNGEIRCWIHDSFFDVNTGAYQSGPALKNSKLPEFKLRIENGKVYRGQDSHKGITLTKPF